MPETTTLEVAMKRFKSFFVNSIRYKNILKRKMAKRIDFSGKRSLIYQRYWETAASKCKADIHPMDNDIFKISKENKATYVQYHYVNIDSYFNLKIADNKPFIHKILKENGFHVPHYLEYRFDSIKNAENFLQEHNYKCVVKPCGGSSGYGITTAINSFKRLRSASLAALSSFYDDKIMIEEELAGDSYRLLYLDGQLLDVIQRKRPTVIGDGSSTIKQLISIENSSRLNGVFTGSMSQLSVDLDLKYYLKDTGRSITSVPKKDELCVVKNVSNENTNRDNIKISDSIHHEFKELALALRETFGFKLIGIDVMTSDITKSLKETGGAVNEINIPPGLHYHELVANTDDDHQIGSSILNYIFSHTVETNL